MQLYCSRYLNSAYRFCWRSMELCYANPPLSQLPKMFRTIALEGARVVPRTPDWGTTEEHAYRRLLLYGMTIGRTELHNGPIDVLEDSQETMPAPEWSSFLSMADGSLNPVLMIDLEQKALKEPTVESLGFILLALKRGSEYSSVTTTSGG